MSLCVFLLVILVCWCVFVGVIWFLCVPLLLFGFVTVLAFKRLGPALTTFLDRQDLHHRLVYGSDWPVPGIAVVVLTSKLVSHG